MGKGKLLKFAELDTMPNVFQRQSPQNLLLKDYQGRIRDLKGRWAEEVFGNANPITLELACGRGEYTVALAMQNPGRNFIGMDIKGARIWGGAKQALEAGLQNVAFLRGQIEHLETYFASGEVNEIWITFPDPFPKKRKAHKRLTSPHFLELYRKVTKPGAAIHLKTDDDKLYRFTLEVLNELKIPIEENIPDIYALSTVPEVLKIQTRYERMHLENRKQIKYLRFRL